jgi:prophage antirepressor-like protein
MKLYNKNRNERIFVNLIGLYPIFLNYKKTPKKFKKWFSNVLPLIRNYDYYLDYETLKKKVAQSKINSKKIENK